MRTYRDEGYHAQHKRPPTSKPSFRRWKLDALTAEIQEILLSKFPRKGHPLIGTNLPDKETIYVTAEELSGKLRAKKHLVVQALHKLRLHSPFRIEERNYALHDSNRDPICGFAGWSGWAATLYRVTKKEKS